MGKRDMLWRALFERRKAKGVTEDQARALILGRLLFRRDGVGGRVGRWARGRRRANNGGTPCVRDLRG